MRSATSWRRTVRRYSSSFSSLARPSRVKGTGLSCMAGVLPQAITRKKRLRRRALSHQGLCQRIVASTSKVVKGLYPGARALSRGASSIGRHSLFWRRGNGMQDKGLLDGLDGEAEAFDSAITREHYLNR